MPQTSSHLVFGMAAKVRAGDLAGIAPRGYVNVRINGRTSIDYDPQQAPLIRAAFGMAEDPSGSLRQIITTLAPLGLVSRTGKPMSAAVLRGILTNPFYTGVIRYKGSEYRGNHPPLVTWATFERVQVRLLQRKRR